MKKQFIALFFAVLPALATAAGGLEYPNDHVEIDLKDKASLQDGARTFANYCMGCHSAKFQRYERVAKDLGIPEGIMLDNLVFTGAEEILARLAAAEEQQGLWIRCGLLHTQLDVLHKRVRLARHLLQMRAERRRAGGRL